jgi:plasmid stability protein
MSWYSLRTERETTRPATPMTLTIHLTDEIERRLRERASREGRSVKEYVLDLIKRDAANVPPPPAPEDHSTAPARELGTGEGMVLSDDEFELLLDGLASGPQSLYLPADFSRADIYADHD